MDLNIININNLKLDINFIGNGIYIYDVKNNCIKEYYQYSSNCIINEAKLKKYEYLIQILNDSFKILKGYEDEKNI